MGKKKRLWGGIVVLTQERICPLPPLPGTWQYLEIFLVVTREDLTTEFCDWHLGAEARDVAKHPTVPRTESPPCQTKNCLAQSLSGARVEKLDLGEDNEIRGDW